MPIDDTDRQLIAQLRKVLTSDTMKVIRIDRNSGITRTAQRAGSRGRPGTFVESQAEGSWTQTIAEAARTRPTAVSIAPGHPACPLPEFTEVRR